MSPLPRLSDILTHLHIVLGSHWQRRRGTLGPPHVFLSLMVMTVLGCKGYQRTIAELKERLGRALGWASPGAEPTSSALCQARQKLDAKRYTEVSAHVLTLCTTARQHASVGYGGFRLLAMDDTKLALPAYRAMSKHFGGPTTASGAMQGPQAALTMLWDVGANLPIAWRLGPYRVSERVHALDMIVNVGPTDLVLGDRGMVSRRMLTGITDCGAHFLMRIRCSGRSCLREATEFLACGRDDALISIRQRDHHGTNTAAAPITARFLRRTLPDGAVADFVTSLCDQQRYPAKDLIALYDKRWGIETALRELKIWHGLKRFHARKPDGIAQEVCALMVFQMLASELEARARTLHGIPDPSTPAGCLLSSLLARDDQRCHSRPNGRAACHPAVTRR